MRLSSTEADYSLEAKATLLEVRRAKKTTVGILDGIGCWGRGRDAAAWSRAHLEARWAKPGSDLSLARVQSDITQLHKVLPDSFRQDEFGASFSLCIAIVEELHVSILAAGAVSAFVQRGRDKMWLFRTRTLTNKLLNEGTITKEEAAESPLKHMLLGPVLNCTDPPELGTAFHRLEPGDTFIAAHHEMANGLSPEDIDSADSARQLQKLGPSHQAGPSALIMLRP